jgi:hypothetical protein
VTEAASEVMTLRARLKELEDQLASRTDEPSPAPECSRDGQWQESQRVGRSRPRLSAHERAGSVAAAAGSLGLEVHRADAAHEETNYRVYRIEELSALNGNAPERMHAPMQRR